MTQGANQESDSKYVLDLTQIAPGEGTPFKGPDGKDYEFRNPLDFELIEASKTERLAKRFNELQKPVQTGEADEEATIEYDQVMTEYVLIVTTMPAEVLGTLKWWQKLSLIGMYRALQVKEQKKVTDKASSLVKGTARKKTKAKKKTGARS